MICQKIYAILRLMEAVENTQQCLGCIYFGYKNYENTEKKGFFFYISGCKDVFSASANGTPL